MTTVPTDDAAAPLDDDDDARGLARSRRARGRGAAARGAARSIDRRPIASYYIASSHNTYLEADQIRGPSSVNRYISDLCTGCRCVELDIWDGPPAAGHGGSGGGGGGGAAGEPIVHHGHTLVGRIALRDVLVAVRQYAFVASPYPLVLSFEVRRRPLKVYQSTVR